jgi:hypothetical protein
MVTMVWTTVMVTSGTIMARTLGTLGLGVFSMTSRVVWSKHALIGINTHKRRPDPPGRAAKCGEKLV